MLLCRWRWLVLPPLLPAQEQDGEQQQLREAHPDPVAKVVVIVRRDESPKDGPDQAHLRPQTVRKMSANNQRQPTTANRIRPDQGISPRLTPHVQRRTLNILRPMSRSPAPRVSSAVMWSADALVHSGAR